METQAVGVSLLVLEFESPFDIEVRGFTAGVAAGVVVTVAAAEGDCSETVKVGEALGPCCVWAGAPQPASPAPNVIAVAISTDA